MVKRMIWSKLLFVVFALSTISIASVVYATNENFDWFVENNDLIKIDYIKSKTVDNTIDESDPLNYETNSEADIVETVDEEVIDTKDPVATNYDVTNQDVTNDVNEDFIYDKVNSYTSLNKESSSEEDDSPKTPSLRFKIGGDPDTPGEGNIKKEAKIVGQYVKKSNMIKIELKKDVLIKKIDLEKNSFELMQEFELGSLERQDLSVK